MSTNDIRSVKQLIRQTLTAASPVSNLVGDRIYTATPRDADAGTMTYPLLIVQVTGGFSRFAGALQSLQIDLYAYSRIDADEALALYQAAFTVLQAVRLYDGTTLAAGGTALPPAGYGREVVRPTDGWNEATKAWYAVGRWEFMSGG